MKIEWQEQTAVNPDMLTVIDTVYDGVNNPAYFLYYSKATGHFYKLESPGPGLMPRWFRSTENLNW